jgi:hypothetical protein
MALLSTGFIIAGAYADKVRKTLFAQLRDHVKRGEVSTQEVARAAAELNRVLYHILVERLKSDKGDVVRARVEYDVEDGRVVWNYDALQLEVFKRVPDEEIRRVVRETASEIDKLLERVIAYNVERAVVTSYGDYLFRVKIGDKVVGALTVTTVNNEMAIVRGAVLEPTPVVIDKSKVLLEGKSVEEVVSSNLANLVRSARNVELAEAERALKSIEAVIESELREEKAKVEEEEIEY